MLKNQTKIKVEELLKNQAENAQALKVTMCVGLLDKDTKQQELNIKDAEKYAHGVMVDMMGYGTLLPCLGGYKHNDGTIIKEPSLLMFWSVSVDDLKDTIDSLAELIVLFKNNFNQESIYLDAAPVSYNFI